MNNLDGGSLVEARARPGLVPCNRQHLCDISCDCLIPVRAQAFGLGVPLTTMNVTNTWGIQTIGNFFLKAELKRRGLPQPNNRKSVCRC